jgi:hypothetical protein
LRIKSAIGVPVVFPSYTPERISTRSSSRRWVTCLEVPGFPAVEVGLDVGFGERHPWRAAIDHAADRRAVRFAEGGDGEEGAEGVAGHGWQFTASLLRSVNHRVGDLRSQFVTSRSRAKLT